MTDVAIDPFAENTRRSITVIQRDQQIARALTVPPAEGEPAKYTVEKLTEVLGLNRNAVYASMVNLKRRELVAKEKTDSRTPVWFLTVAGAKYVAQLPAV